MASCFQQIGHLDGDAGSVAPLVGPGAQRLAAMSSVVRIALATGNW
jgi:hypothetical protein